MMSLISGEEKEYLSSDSIWRSGENYDVQSEWFTLEFLNGIKSSGIPNHRLKLKGGMSSYAVEKHRSGQWTV